MNLNWHGEECLADIRAKLEKRTESVATVLYAELVDALSRPSPPPSPPGVPPGRHTGGLLRGIIRFYDAARRTWAVGFAPSVAAQARALEYGTHRMAARPFLAAVLRYALPRLQKVARG